MDSAWLHLLSAGAFAFVPDRLSADRASAFAGLANRLGW